MRATQFPGKKYGSIIVLVVISLVILAALGGGLLSVGFGVRHRAIATKNAIVAMFAAEAGYEKAIFWMSQQPDLLTALHQDESPGGTISFPDSSCDYTVSFYSFIGSRPVYKIVSNGHSGSVDRAVDVLILQAIEGWESGHSVPSGSSSSVPWPFGAGEIIDIPLHVIKHDDNPDVIDIYITGDCDFRQRVSIGEGRYAGSVDKYGDVMNLFNAGICFNQPDSKVTDTDSVQQKVDRFRDSTDARFKFAPVANGPITRPNAAVQLEFFVEDGVGKVRITNNCTVRGYRYEDSPAPEPTYDYKINDSGSGNSYTKYDIYAYHLRPTGESPVTIPVTDTYVAQSFGGVDSQPGGQIFINGNVIIGGDYSGHENSQVIKGKITVVATGNIWVADSVTVDGTRDGDLPALDNPNILGLISQGVVKVVDPGMSDASYVDSEPVEPEGFEYVPVAQPDGGTLHSRELPSQMEVEAAITVGGGGWGAENVGNRKTTSPTTWGYNKLIVRGTITEAMRGIVGTSQPLWSGVRNGYMKSYYLDGRLLQGILPGDIWLKGKYVPAPAGWHDYQTVN